MLPCSCCEWPQGYNGCASTTQEVGKEVAWNILRFPLAGKKGQTVREDDQRMKLAFSLGYNWNAPSERMVEYILSSIRRTKKTQFHCISKVSKIFLNPTIYLLHALSSNENIDLLKGIRIPPAIQIANFF